MKTLYININNEQIASNEELEVLNYDLDSDFFFYLGEKIAKGCKVENENALITDFNTKDNEEDYKQIIAQWNEIKAILFGEECEGIIEFTLPNGYIHWLRYSEKYNHVYDKKFSHGESTIISIDLEKLYEDSVEDLQRKILRKLQRDDFYLEIDEIVFNDDAVTRKSPIVRTIKEKYNSAGFISYKKWIREKGEYYTELINNSVDNNERLIWPIELSNINLDKILNAGYTPMSILGHDDTNYIILATKGNKSFAVNTYGQCLYDFEYREAIPTSTGKFIIVKNGLFKIEDGKELLPVSFLGNDLVEIEPNFFSNNKVGIYCAPLEVHCAYLDKHIFIDEKYCRLYSKKTWEYLDLKQYITEYDRKSMYWTVDRINQIYQISVYKSFNKFTFLTNIEAKEVYVLRSNEAIESVNDNQIVLKQFHKTSAILNGNFDTVFKADYILDSDERVVDVSDGMTIIMDDYKITRILDEQYNNIFDHEESFLTIDKPIKFQSGIAVYQISKKRIGYMNKKGKHIEIPWNYGNTISSIEVLIPPFILVTKTSEEQFIINTSGESMLDIGRWDKIRKLSDTQFEIYSSTNSTLYEIKNDNIQEVL